MSDGDPLDGPNRHAYCAAEIQRLRAELADRDRRTTAALELIDRHVRYYNTVGAVHPYGGLNAIRAALTNPNSSPATQNGPTS